MTPRTILWRTLRPTVLVVLNKTGTVVDGDLVPSSDLKSAVFTAHAPGSAQIHAAFGAFPVTDGGVITVTVGTATKVRVETKADGTGTVVAAQTLLSSRSITVYAISRDNADNFVANITATLWPLGSITGGVVSGDLTPRNRDERYLHRSYPRGQRSFRRRRQASRPHRAARSPSHSAPRPKIRVETKADGTGVIVPAQSIMASRSINVYAISRDSSDNFLANIAATTCWMQSVTGGVADSNLAASPGQEECGLHGRNSRIRTDPCAASTGHTSVPSGS